MKKILSYIHVLIMVLCLCFVACERNEDVVVCTLAIESEQLTTEYPTATIQCLLLTDATIETVEAHLSQTQDFSTDFIILPMTLQADGSYSAQTSDLQEEVIYYVRYVARNRYSEMIISNLSTIILTTRPEVITSEPTQISMFSAMVGGEVLKDNGYDVTTRGICYSTTENPTINDSKVERGKNIGSFTCELTGLTPQTVYYARAFATNANGTAYGQQVTFTTKSAPEVYTDEVISGLITSYSAVVSGGYTSDGGEAITDCGICYSFSPNPTVADMFISHSVAPSFECSLTDLRPHTTYYARAYVTNKNGTAYGNEVTFNTLTNIPVVQTVSAQRASTTSIAMMGTVVSDGGYTVFERGVCYSTNATPTTSDSKVTNDVGIGAYNCTITELQAGTTYYVRAYAINSEGTGYGEILEVKP